MVAAGGMGEWRTGAPGLRNHPGPPAAVVAERLEQMQHAARATRAERVEAARRWLESLADMPLEELRRSTPTRLWSVAMLHLGGYDAMGIGRALGYTTHKAARKALTHPAVKRIVELIRAEQVERVLRGEYGVQAQAKAAAPAVMEHVAELAGGVKDRATGERRGRAKRDSDALRGAELLLTISGDKVERKAVIHAHLFDQMTDVELEVLAASGAWPERLQGVAGMIAGPPSE